MRQRVFSTARRWISKGGECHPGPPADGLDCRWQVRRRMTVTVERIDGGKLRARWTWDDAVITSASAAPEAFAWQGRLVSRDGGTRSWKRLVQS